MELRQSVPWAANVKISRLRLTNLSGRRRHISCVAYVAWTLGASREATQAFVSAKMDPQMGAMLARNRWSAVFGGWVAFLDLLGTQSNWTGGRLEFLGRGGCMEAPAVLGSRVLLSGRVGSGIDPCGAMRRSLVLAPGTSAEIVCLFG